MADVNCIPQIERFDKSQEIVCISIHVVAAARLARAPVTAPVVGDASITIPGKKKHLILKGIGRQRPAMTEDYWLSRAPVVVVNLRSVFCRDRAHFNPFFLVSNTRRKFA
jgi:hypothetical protein